MKEALFYIKKDKKEVSCFLCNHKCQIKSEAIGICGVRKNQEGILYTLNYGQVIAANIDPIEKKPLFHVLPGSFSYSMACVGCNFKCGFCQNWQISQAEFAKKIGVEEFNIAPDKIVEEATKNKCPSISYTYTEPTIYFEFAYECSRLAKAKGLYNIFVSNGYMSKEALEYISPYLDAANVDLKSFREDFYRKICKASLKPVLENIALMKKLNIWVEITTLVIPEVNDTKEELSDIASFIASLDKNIPWHVSAFHPDYKFTDFLPTQPTVLKEAYEIGKGHGLKFVYIGNVHTDYGENTFCPSCLKPVIERMGFFIKNKKIKDGKCAHCGAVVAGIRLS